MNTTVCPLPLNRLLTCEADIFSVAQYAQLYTLTYTDIEDLANQCAAQQDKDTSSNPSGASQTFVITMDDRSSGSNCITAITTLKNYPSFNCNSGTYAFYAPA
jgi:hypothetical protein